MWNDNAGTPTKFPLGANFPKTKNIPYVCVFDRTAAGVPFVIIWNRTSNVFTKVTMNDANAPRLTVDYGFQWLVGSGTDATALACIDIGMVEGGHF